MHYRNLLSWQVKFLESDLSLVVTIDTNLLVVLSTTDLLLTPTQLYWSQQSIDKITYNRECVFHCNIMHWGALWVRDWAYNCASDEWRSIFDYDINCWCIHMWKWIFTITDSLPPFLIMFLKLLIYCHYCNYYYYY